MMWSPIRSAAFAVGLAAAAVLCAGCGLTTTTEASGDSIPLPTLVPVEEPTDVPAGRAVVESSRTSVDIDRIVMIGDSITVASQPELIEAFAAIGFPDPLIVSQEGKRMASDTRSNPSGVSVAEFLTAEESDRSGELWIVALGTNDISQYEPDELRIAMDEMLAAVPADAPLLWVDTFFRGEPEGTAAVNDMIERRVAARGNATIARWSEVADTEGALRVDGVHPRPLGSELFAKTIVSTLPDLAG